MAYDRNYYYSHCSLVECDRLIRMAEDRMSRAETSEASTADAYAIQELEAACEMIEKGLPPARLELTQDEFEILQHAEDNIRDSH